MSGVDVPGVLTGDLSCNPRVYLDPRSGGAESRTVTVGKPGLRVRGTSSGGTKVSATTCSRAGGWEGPP